MTAPTSDKPVRHIPTISGDKSAPCFRAFDMLDPILTRHYPKPIVGGSRGAFKVGDMSLKSPKKALVVSGSVHVYPTMGKL